MVKLLVGSGAVVELLVGNVASVDSTSDIEVRCVIFMGTNCIMV